MNEHARLKSIQDSFAAYLQSEAATKPRGYAGNGINYKEKSKCS